MCGQRKKRLWKQKQPNLALSFTDLTNDSLGVPRVQATPGFFFSLSQKLNNEAHAVN
jgi:hypothetical protein